MFPVVVISFFFVVVVVVVVVVVGFVLFFLSFVLCVCVGGEGVPSTVRNLKHSKALRPKPALGVEEMQVR